MLMHMFTGGPPRFMCPIVEGTCPLAERSALPYLLYLPGIDGTGLAVSQCCLSSSLPRFLPLYDVFADEQSHWSHYEPGLLQAYKQFPALAEAFDLVALSVPPHDRTGFPNLVEIVE